MSELSILLQQLKLPAFVQHWNTLSLQGEQKGWSYEEYLTTLAEREIANRFTKRVQLWNRESDLPIGKTLSTLQMDLLAPEAVKTIRRHAENDSWIHAADNLILVGPSGVGKSHIAAAIGYSMIEKGIRVCYLAAVDLVQRLQKAKQELTLMDAMTKFDKYRLVIVDDIGYVRKSDMETDVLFEFIAHRYESGSLVITANQPFSNWNPIFNDNIMTVAAIDRLVHHASIIQLQGESYRTRQQLTQIKF